MAGRLRIRLAILAMLSLLFAWFQTAYAHVEPPTNVTFRCNNLRDLLQWSYEPRVAGLRFRVNIRSLQSPAVVLWVDPPALQANLSLLTSPVDYNLVNVVAVVGKNESEEAPANGIKFTYVRNSLVKHKCSVDFPPVAVHVDANGHILFNFKHPWLLYSFGIPHAKSRKRKSDEKKMPTHTPDFSYTVKVNQHLEENFVCATNNCEGKLQTDPGQDRQCLKVEGEMQMMFVRGSQEYCDSLLQPVHNHNKIVNIIIGMVIAVVVIAVAVVAYIVYKKKTNPSPLSPKSVMFNDPRRPGTLNLPKDQFPVPKVEPRRLQNDESGEDVTPTGPSTEPDLRFRLGVENELAEVRCDEGSEYTPGSESEAALLNGSGYEQRPVVRVELAPGEEAEGYRLGGL